MTSSSSTSCVRPPLHDDGKEFGGKWGAFLITFFLPVVPYALYFLCPDNSSCLAINYQSSFPFISVGGVSNPFIDGKEYRWWDWNVFGVYLLWWFSQALLYMIVPSNIVTGVALPQTKNTRLYYRINAFRCALITLFIIFFLVQFNYLSATYAYDNFLPLITSMIIFSVLLSLFLYIHSYITVPYNNPNAIDIESYPDHVIAHNDGGFFYIFFLGRLLNPRIGEFDFKYFCELRPGLLLWVLIDMSMAAAAYRSFGTLPLSSLLIVLFHSVYVLDSYAAEAAILTTMDITTEGFGYMLAFGDHAWVPCVYSFPARYLANYDIQLSPHFAALIIFIKFFGMYIFRASNSEKNAFRTNPSDPAVSHLSFIITERGTKLITNGWWGLSRHINYCGDLLMGLAYCLPCGFNHILCYFYIIYFSILLIHRERRDDAACRQKYGKDWEKYCELVPYRIFPYIY